MTAGTVDENQILQALHRVPTNQWGNVLEFIDRLSPGAIDCHDVSALARTTWTADALQKLPLSLQNAVLRAQTEVLVQSQSGPALLTWWRARELGKLPCDQRGIIWEASATVAAKEYETNAELTAFEAFGEDDLYVDSSDAMRKPQQVRRFGVSSLPASPHAGVDKAKNRSMVK